MVEWLVNIGLYFWGLFKLWITTLFVAPFQHADMLWLLIPIWGTWFFAEFFQEKQGTSMGNAITNSVIVIWGSIDCSRQTVKLITTGILNSFWDIATRFFIIALILGYGVVIVVLGLKGKKIIKYIGRIREVTYAFAIFAPIFYNAIDLTINHIIAAVLFFPLFYFAIELIDRYTPNPKAIVEDLEEKEGEKGAGGLGGGLGGKGFGEEKGLGDLGTSKETAPGTKGKKDEFSDLKF
jgi:hypothetical protein